MFLFLAFAVISRCMHVDDLTISLIFIFTTLLDIYSVSMMDLTFLELLEMLHHI